MRHFAPEFAEDPRLNGFHRLYIKIFGIPISGLRIRLRRILPEIQGNYRHIADLGCGRGVFTFELARKFPDAKVVGIDIDREQIEANKAIAERSGARNVKFEACDLMTLGSTGAFDLVLSVDNLEHIKDDVGALKVIRGALRDGGTLVCHVPAARRIWFLLSYKSNFDIPSHERPGYEITELESKLRSAGFREISVKPTYGWLETISNNISYLITGAKQKNQLLYALIFPFLNLMAWAGRAQNPGSKGAGILARAVK